MATISGIGLVKTGFRLVEFERSILLSSALVMGVLCRPEKVAGLTKYGIIATKLGLKMLLNKVRECRTRILSLACLSTFCYYNTTAGAVVAPYYQAMINASASLANEGMLYASNILAKSGKSI